MNRENLANNFLTADNYVTALAKETSGVYSFKNIGTMDLQKWQDSFRDELIKTLGINNIISRGIPALDPVKANTEILHDHIRERWYITSEPGYRIPFILLKPLDFSATAPLVLAAHGHGKYGKETYAGISFSDEDKKHMEEGERDIALQAVKKGYVAIAPDQRAFGETRFTRDIDEDKNNSCRTMQMHALLFGRTLIGERVFDISRLIDFANTQDYINTDRIVLTGNSGGGTTTLFAAAIDRRISIAIPGSYFCTFENSIGSINHCECNYIPGIMNLGEMHDVAGLIAPRPFLAVHGTKDTIFPIEATRRAFEELRVIYEAFGARDKAVLYEGRGGHRYYKERVWSFVKFWFENHLT